MTYRGRFAPSPTGPLHLGSLVAALGSFLDARANQGEWLVRMEDLDPPREMPGAKTLIPKQLEQHGFFWDGDIELQSQRLLIYEQHIEALVETGLCFTCFCSRQRIKALGGNYDGHCRSNHPGAESTTSQSGALRVQLEHNQSWKDLIQETQTFTAEQLHGDFVIQRRDGLFSYQLAVAIDDSLQNMTHVIRGADLIDSTARQLYLQKLLNLKSPLYGHLPVVINRQGQKLSKQNLAASLDETPPAQNLYRALALLGQSPETSLQQSGIQEVIHWAIENWSLGKVPKNDQLADTL